MRKRKAKNRRGRKADGGDEGKWERKLLKTEE